jgi:hypothetical protein
MMTPWRNRAVKAMPKVRCCWVCGKPGGNGFTKALQLEGYRIEPGKEIGYAHPKCMMIAQEQDRKRRQVRPIAVSDKNCDTARPIDSASSRDSW